MAIVDNGGKGREAVVFCLLTYLLAHSLTLQHIHKKRLCRWFGVSRLVVLGRPVGFRGETLVFSWRWIYQCTVLTILVWMDGWVDRILQRQLKYWGHVLLVWGVGWLVGCVRVGCVWLCSHPNIPEDA